MASVDFVRGVFLKLLVYCYLSFALKRDQKIAVNCLLEGRDIFAVWPTGFGIIFSCLLLVFFLIPPNEISNFLKNKHV